MADPASLRHFALELLAETDRILLDHVRAGLEVRTKPDGSLVTQADLDVERHLRERISALFPDHGLLGEEFHADHRSGELRWIIDPVDGTHNLVRGIPVYATLLAVEAGDQLLAAAISAPALQRRWHAAAGMGATVDDLLGPRPMRVSTIDRLEEAQLVWSGLAPMEAAGHGAALQALASGAWRDRGFGDFWGYMLVAEGAAEAMLEIGPTTWDLAAPALILAEAGGRLTNFAGDDSYHGPDALASNGVLHPALVTMLAG